MRQKNSASEKKMSNTQIRYCGLKYYRYKRKFNIYRGCETYRIKKINI